MQRKEKRSILTGAAFLLAISAVGPGLMVELTTFTAEYGSALGAVLLCVIVMDVLSTLNIWSVLGAANMRAQDVANKLLPGLGMVFALAVSFGGVVFNTGNIGGAALGMNALFGFPMKLGFLLSGILASAVFFSARAGRGIDFIVKILGVCTVLLVTAAAFQSRQPVRELLHVQTEFETRGLFYPMLTLLGGSCGGYIAFSGIHRLLDEGVKGVSELPDIRRSAFLGTTVSGIVRLMIFLAALGVCAAGGNEVALQIQEAANPTTEVFSLALGRFGRLAFELILLVANIGSIICATFTSVSFLKTLHPFLARHERALALLIIFSSTTVMTVFGNAARMMIFAGTINGFILPFAMLLVLAAARRKDIVGDYRHPLLLRCAGVVIVLAGLWAGLQAILK